MNAPSRAAWLAGLARLGSEDLKRISRLVDLLTTAARTDADMARNMLSARPEPATAAEARERCETVIAYLEKVAADDHDADQAERLP